MLLVAQLLVSMLVGGAVFMLVVALFGGSAPVEPPMHRRIASALGIDRQTVFESPLLGPLMAVALSLTKQMNWPGLRASIRKHLNACGNPSGYSVDEYMAICLVSGVGVGAVVVVFELFVGSTLVLLAGPAFAAAGFFAPLFALRAAGDRRVTRIGKQLPYALDLVSLTMASGSSFAEAIKTLINDDPADDLNVELGIVLGEIEYGTPRAQALRGMADRIPLESLRSVVGAVNQAEALGTPMATILKLQADMLRNARSVRAEKLSASASLRILVPTMLILIAVVIIVFGPIILRYLNGEFVL